MIVTIGMEKMMKHIKKLLSIILVFAICITPINAEATGKNVTSSMKKNKAVKKIVRDICTYTTCELCERRSTKTKKESLKGYNALSIAGFIGYQHGQYDYTSKEIQKITNNLFGIKPKTSSIPSLKSSKKKWISKSSCSITKKPYMYSGGDWGCYQPKYAIKKIVKVKKDTYDITVANKLHIMDEGKTRNVGTTYMRIKKYSKSSYKYKVTKLKYKGNGSGY